MKTLGQIAYEAYCESVNNLSFTGVVLPKWEDSTDNIRKAWAVAAKAVKYHVGLSCDFECSNWTGGETE
jgi:hypothetical protein